MMEETTDGANKQKLKFDDSEYFLDDLIFGFDLKLTV